MTVTDAPSARTAAEPRPAPVERSAIVVEPGGWRAGAASAWKRFCARPTPTVVLYAVLATASTMSNSPGNYVGDNRFEQYWNPARRVARSLSVWDGTRGLGRVREDFWPGGTIPMAIFRSLGANPIITERLWHALLLTVAGVGMVEVMRLWHPRRSLEHLLAGLALMFGAYSASFLTPFSNLYLQFAMAPWLIVAFTRGLTSNRPWRWSGVFALLVLVPGNVDIPGLVYNMVPLITLSLYLLLVERSVTLRRYLVWVSVTGSLTLVTNAAVLAKIWIGSAAFNQRLNDTEAAEISFRASSWPESARGLGNWLSYFRDNGQLLKPQFATYFDNPWVILCTFVPVIVAFLTFWLSRWRPRILFASVALSSLFVLVGAFPKDAPPPIGVQILKAFNNIPFLTAFRNTYKVGSGLAIGLSALFGYGIASAVRRVAKVDYQLAAVPLLVATGAMTVTAFPFWSGNLYNDTQQFREVPGYWSEAMGWLDERPGDDRALILPMTSRSRYRWGWVGDDIFDALLARPHAVATGVPLSTPQAANLIEAISYGAADPAYQHGTLAPILRRLGIRYIVLRNDLDWKAVKRPRPAAFDGLRTDPELVVAATFGQPGENTTAPDDESPDATAERELAPVEILELREPGPAVARMIATQPPMLVSGDGGAWAPLAQAGYLDADVPIQYTGAFTPDQLRDALASGGSVIVTDSNRRRLRVMLSYEPDYSATLAEGQDLDRVVKPAFPADGSSTVAWYPDAKEITLTGPSRSTDGSSPWYRPANVFDGNPATIWSMRKTELPLSRRFQVYLRKPQSVGHVSIDIPALQGDGGKGIQALQLRFSDGSTVDVDLKGILATPGTGLRHVEVDFDPKLTTYIEVAIRSIDPAASVVGISDITFPGIDLREFLQAPADVQLQAATRPDITNLATKAPFTFLFSRIQGSGPQDEETMMRRRFLVIGDRQYTLSGELLVRPGTTDASINRLIDERYGDRPLLAEGSRRFEGDPHGWGGFAVDGDPTTSWVAPARANEVLTVRRADGPADVRTITVSSARTTGFAVPQKVTVTVAGVEHQLQRPPVAECPVGVVSPRCSDLTLTLEAPVSTDLVTVRVDDVLGESTKLKIDEVVLDGRTNSPLVLDQPDTSCRPIGLELGPEAGAAPSRPSVRIEGTLQDLLDGEQVAYSSCDPVRMRRDWYRAETGTSSAIESIELSSTDAVPPKARRANGLTWQVDQPSATEYHITADAPNGAVLVLEQSFAEGWTATVNGRPLGSSKPYDTMNGWQIDERGKLDITLRFGGQRIFNYALAITLLGILLCAVLIARVPRTRPPPRRARDG